MKAIRFYGKEDVRVEDVAAPTAMGDTQVMVKPLTCGICGTDLHEFAGGPIVTPSTPHKFTGAVLPQILGHEFSAEVLDVGGAVTRVRKGDRVLSSRSLCRWTTITAGAASIISAPAWVAWA